MPLYEYQCQSCGHRFEVIQKYSDALVEICPSCGGPVQKLASSPAIQFKGTGWYVTDYAKKQGSDAEKAESTPADSGNKADSGSQVDSGSRTDSGSKADAGNKTDSGSRTDSGSQTGGEKAPAGKSGEQHSSSATTSSSSTTSSSASSSSKDS